MNTKNKSIPINNMADEFGIGISIDKNSFKDLRIEEANKSHRDDGHSFFLVESGIVHIEIDFKQYKIEAQTILYMHPNQVHRLLSFENVIVSSWSINTEKLNPDYLTVLESITPTKPVVLENDTFSTITEAIALTLKFYKRKNDKLYQSLLKDSCNALVALVISQFLEKAKSTDKLSRFDSITKSFRELVEQNYSSHKRPTEYAKKLNISTSYLNECIKHTTGYSVSHHIQQRIILEAKRLLSHSDRSVKEIAVALGYDDYPYFSRLFKKVVGMTALTFRNKNLD